MTTALDARKGIVKGSLTDIAAQHGHSLAQTFVNAEVVILIDTSGSMDTHDSRGGRKRYDVACEELAALQGNLPGKIAVLSFSDQTMFCPDGKPFNQPERQHRPGGGAEVCTRRRCARHSLYRHQRWRTERGQRRPA